MLDPDSGDYALTEGSPAIDAGNPLPVFKDPDATRNDMGAFYLDQLEIPDDITSVGEDSRGDGQTTWGRTKSLFR